MLMVHNTAYIANVSGKNGALGQSTKVSIFKNNHLKVVHIYPGADTGGVLWVLKHPPLSQDNIQVSIDIWLSNQL